MWSASDLDLRSVQSIAIESKLTFYDSSYIYLAKRLNCPLATEDAELAERAGDLGITVYRLGDFL